MIRSLPLPVLTQVSKRETATKTVAVSIWFGVPPLGGRLKAGLQTNLWCSKPPPVLRRTDKCLHHLSGNEIAIELIQLRQPEIVTGVVRVRSIVRVPSQLTEELHQHERAIEFSSRQIRVLGDVSHDARAGFAARGERRRFLRLFSQRHWTAGIHVECVN